MCVRARTVPAGPGQAKQALRFPIGRHRELYILLSGCVAFAFLLVTFAAGITEAELGLGQR